MFSILFFFLISPTPTLFVRDVWCDWLPGNVQQSHLEMKMKMSFESECLVTVNTSEGIQTGFKCIHFIYVHNKILPTL